MPVDDAVNASKENQQEICCKASTKSGERQSNHSTKLQGGKVTLLPFQYTRSSSTISSDMAISDEILNLPSDTY